MLGACSKSESGDTPDGNTRQIKAVSAIEGVASKAVIAGTDAALTGLQFLRVDDVSTNKTTSFDFSAATVITGGSRVAGGVITFGTSVTDGFDKYDKAGDKTTYMRGFTTDGATSTAGVKTEWAINGATDVLLTDVWNAGRYSLPGTNTMTFKHQLSRIEVVCKGEQNIHNDVTHDIWGNVTSIKVVDALPTLTYTYNTDAVTGTGTSADFPLLKEDTYDAAQPFAAKRILDYTAADAVFGSAMLWPLTSTVKLKVTTQNKAEQEISTTLSKMERAKIHKIVLTFNTDGKTITCTTSTIEEWEAGTGGTGSLPVN